MDTKSEKDFIQEEQEKRVLVKMANFDWSKN
jgi:hypothetical protein